MLPRGEMAGYEAEVRESRECPVNVRRRQTQVTGRLWAAGNHRDPL